MTPHVADELPALLAGELPAPATGAVLRHVRGCSTCTDELHDMLRGHAALRRAARLLGPDALLAPEPAAGRALPPLVLPELPDRGHRHGRPGRRLPSRRLAGAAAAVLVAGAAGGAVALGGSGHRAAPQVVETASLRPVAGGTAPSASGRVTMALARGDTRMTMTVSAAALPPAGTGHFYEVWLLRPSVGRMLPVGLLAPSGPAEDRFQIPAAVADSYSAVDVSLEADDGDPAHSADSVLRARLS